MFVLNCSRATVETKCSIVFIALLNNIPGKSRKRSSSRSENAEIFGCRDKDKTIPDSSAVATFYIDPH